jgi:hypothetical protein
VSAVRRANGVAARDLAVREVPVQAWMLRRRAAELQYYCATISTGVPTSTSLKSVSASGTRMRMHPWDAE